MDFCDEGDLFGMITERQRVSRSQPLGPSRSLCADVFISISGTTT
jgi:hypothetical protein